MHAHSIIAVQGTGPVEDGADGVVAYKSAHIEGVDSEKVVNSGHSCQSKPEAIAEVRRILVEHAADTCTRERVACPTAAAAPESPRRQTR